MDLAHKIIRSKIFNNSNINMEDRMKELDRCIGMMYFNYHECPLPNNDKLLNWSFNLIKHLEAAKNCIAQHCSIENTYHDFNMQLAKYVMPIYEVLQRCYDNIPCRFFGSDHHIYLYNQLGNLKRLFFGKDECKLSNK